MRYLLPLLLFAAITVFLYKGLQNDPHQLTSALLNKPVVTFSYPSLLNSRELLTQDQFLDHVSLLNVWATWCVSCQAEHPVLMEIARSKKVIIYGLDYKDDLRTARSWLHEYGNPYRDVIADDKGTLAIDLGVYGTPETFVIDKKGIIRYKYVGPISPDAWKNIIEPEVEKWERQF